MNATGGVEIGTERAQRMSAEQGVPSIFFINKLDKEHADFARCVEAINRKFKKNCVLVTYPVGQESSFKGVVNLVTRHGIEGLQESDKQAAKAAIDRLAEAVAETDDALLEKYLDKGELAPDELKEALKKAICACKIHPILCGSATKNMGVKELLDFMAEFMPAPSDRPQAEASKADGSGRVALKLDPNGPFAALVFKTLSDPFLGQISIFKIFS